jgi:hypothetical protein
VREPILKELLGYRKARSETAKEEHRRRLRELFERIKASAAELSSDVEHAERACRDARR